MRFFVILVIGWAYFFFAGSRAYIFGGVHAARAAPGKIELYLHCRTMLSLLLSTSARFGLGWFARGAVALGADIHANAGIAIRLASQNGHLGLVQYLANASSADANILQRCMEHAVAGGHLRIVKYLVLIGARMMNYTAPAAIKGGHLELVEFWLSSSSVTQHYLCMCAAQAASYKQYGCVAAIMNRDVVAAANLSEFSHRKPRLYRILRIAAVRKRTAEKILYFWWVPQCYDRSRRAGRRMSRRNRATHRRLCVI